MNAVEHVPLPFRIVLHFLVFGAALAALSYAIAGNAFTLRSVIVLAVVAALIEAAFLAGQAGWRRFLGD